MPSISLFNRRSPLSGDELQPLCTVVIVARLFQLLLLIPMLTYILHAVTQNSVLDWWLFPPTNQENCRNSNLFPLLFSIYAFSTLGVTLFSIGLEIRIMKESSVGTPTQQELRPNIPLLLETKLLPLAIVQSIVWIVGLVAVSYSVQYYSCLPEFRDVSAPELLPALSWYLPSIFLLLSQGIEFVSGIVTLSALRCASTPHGRRRDGEDVEEGYHYNHTDSVWEDRCHFCCRISSVFTCYLFGGQNLDIGEYGEIARVLSDYFEHGGVLDVTLSDLAVGMMMLRRKQQQRELEARKRIKEQVSAVIMEGRDEDEDGDGNGDAVDEGGLVGVSMMGRVGSTRSSSAGSLSRADSGITRRSDMTSTMTFRLRETSDRNLICVGSRRHILSPYNVTDASLIAEGARFARHALAIYTWMLYVYMKPCTGFCRLGVRGPCCACCHRKNAAQDDKRTSLVDETSSLTDTHTLESHIVGDNTCNAHLNALLLQSKLDSTEIMYAQFENSIAQTPYYIALDHKWKSIVLAIRGTLSLEDCVADVLVDAGSLAPLGEKYGFDGAGEYCHNGVLRCAKWIKDDLDRHRLLDTCIANEDYRDYTLRLTGHSLGAGCAVILSFMLKSKYPSLRCICISPPGGLVTRASAWKCKDYITSFVLHSDLIPRLSVHNMEHFRNETLSVIGRIQVPKFKIMNSGLSQCLVSCCTKNGEEYREAALIDSINSMMLPDNSESHSESYASQLEEFQEIQSRRKAERNRIDVRMFPPGKLIHLKKITGGTSFRDKCASCLSCGMSNSGSSYSPTYALNDDFDEIMISPTMWTDHFPNRVCLELEAIQERFEKETTDLQGNLTANSADRSSEGRLSLNSVL